MRQVSCPLICSKNPSIPCICGMERAKDRVFIQSEIILFINQSYSILFINQSSRKKTQ